MSKPMIVCLDLEGVLVPEIWINVSQKTGIPELSLTTRDIPDYDALMARRLKILDQHGLTLHDIQNVIAGMGPMEGARECLDWIRHRCQVIILSDTFSEFAFPLMKQLGFPTIFCHRLEVEPTGRIAGYQLRMPDQKRCAVASLKALNFRVIAAGDSYNDTPMLEEADVGIFFRPPQTIARQFPKFPVTHTYEELQKELVKAGIPE